MPFGTALNTESTLTTNPKRFTSYERSARTELDYAVNRTYDSKQGRFTQVDPAGMEATSLAAPQTLNLYVYCANDPINHLDPSGLGFFSFLKKLFKWIVAIIAVVVAILTIVAAPATIAGILAAVSATASAGSSVMSALGYTTAAKILGWIAIGTGIGAGIAAIRASSNIANSIIVNLASTGESASHISWWQVFLGGVRAGSAVGNSLVQGKPRKRYRTAQQAAIAILQEINARSIRINREIAGFICKLKPGVFISTVPVVLGPAGGGIPNTCPKDSQLAGLYHTHAHWEESSVIGGTDWNEQFSGLPGSPIPGDVASAEGGNLPSWLATPSGNLMRYSRNPAGWQVATVGRTKIK
ncbi:MAG: RHS repeat-associated core domain-containing protein [Acidobacteriota bacterium]